MHTILVVDDSPTIRRMVRAALGALTGVAFVERASGLRAHRSARPAAVHLVVLDLNMPDMHGLDVIRFLRTHHPVPGTAVMVLTTRGDDTSREAAMHAGASIYLTKPFIPSALVAAAKDLLETARLPRA
jgi:two-component system chemotaxis response regulator CheY